jgi:hypothetical protein
LIGTLLKDKWRVLEKLGAGSFGSVYKVQDVRGGWIEALKILGVDRLTGAEADNLRRRFLREAQIMKRLGAASPHIVGLGTYEEDIEAGLIYFLMEFVEGRSLAAALQSEGPFGPERVVRLGLQICEALMAAHEGPEPVVHRDLKLENLMLSTDASGAETVKVLDFGIAKIAEREADSRLTTVGTLGTPGYAAPEQLRAEDVDARTDLFSFGVILYALLTGRDPWLGNPAHEPTHQIYELMAATDRGEIRPMSEAGVDVPPALVYVVTRLLRRDPSQRYQSARELREALQRIADGGSVAEAASLRVLTEKPGVHVEIRKGRRLVAEGATPRVLNGAEAGTYRIVVDDPRYEPVETSVVLDAGAMEDVTLATAPRARGARAAARRRLPLLTAGLLVILALAAVELIQPWGRTVSLQELRAHVTEGRVAGLRLADGALEGRLAWGPLSTPFVMPLAEGDVPDLVAELRADGLVVETSFEVRRLLDLAAAAQARSRYFGMAGADVLTYAQRLAILEPGSPEAASLLLKVGEHMAWDADAAIAAGAPDAAQRLVRTCLALVADHPRCTAVGAEL